MTEIKLEKIRKRMKNKKIDAVLVHSFPNYFYLSGFSGSLCWLLITLKKAYIFADFRYWAQVGREVKGFSLIKIAKGGSDLYLKINRLIRKEKLKNIGIEEKALSVAEYEDLKKNIKNVNFCFFHDDLAGLRTIKSKEEIKIIKEALKITEKAFNDIVREIKPGMTEKEISAKLQYKMKLYGADKESFDIIVAAGKNSALPHAKVTDKKIKEGEFIVIDFGVSYKGYKTDITRTIVLGEVSSKQKKIFDILRQAQKKAFKKIGPNVKAVSVDRTARTYIAGCGFGKNFGHSLGHGIGIEVHESPTIGPKSSDILSSGMIFSIEPGIYINNYGGARIEDLVLVKNGGLEILTERIGAYGR